MLITLLNLKNDNVDSNILIESAIYHVAIHSVNFLSQQINLANQFIANDDSVARITYKSDSIDVEFKNVKNDAKCVVNIKRIENVNSIILKTLIPKRK